MYVFFPKFKLSCAENEVRKLKKMNALILKSILVLFVFIKSDFLKNKKNTSAGF